MLIDLLGATSLESSEQASLNVKVNDKRNPYDMLALLSWVLSASLSLIYVSSAADLMLLETTNICKLGQKLQKNEDKKKRLCAS
jgi:hypothetical protein